MARIGFLGWLVVLLLVCPAPAIARPPATVGYQETKVPNGDEPPLAIAIWYPSTAPAAPQALELFSQTVARNGAVAGHHLPLIVISHGGGGSLASHYDTALALAKAGFVVAAVTHAGDTYDDQSQVLKLWRRPAHLKRVVSYMLADWRDHSSIDARRVGAYGFSNGGFTVLAAAGGIPDLRRIDAYCAENPGHDLCQRLRQGGITSVAKLPIPADAWVSDTRIKAIVTSAPAFGFTFGKSGLAGVRVPVQLWRAAEDDHQPDLWYDAAVRAALPRPPEYHLVPKAGHYIFLAPCSAALAKVAAMVCTDRDGFDRGAFHRAFNAELVRFFRAKLR